MVKGFFVFLIFPSVCLAYVSINVGQAHVRQSQIAFQPLVLLSSVDKESANLGSTLFQVIQGDLSTSGYFALISQEAFLEKPGEKNFEPYPNDPNGFIWKNWQLLNTDYLLMGSYSIENKRVKLELYLYHIPLRRKIFQKKYSVSTSQTRKLAHFIGNDILEALTKKRGVFLTKIVAIRKTKGTKKELFIMDWDGKNKKQISFHNSIVLSPAWSPRGRFIAYSSFLYQKSKQIRNANLVLYDRLQKNRRIISTHTGANLPSDFFPDGKYLIASLFLGRGYRDIVKMSVANGSIQPLTSGPDGAINVEARINSSGEQIIFSSDRSGSVMIYSMDKNGKNIKRLTYQGSYNSHPDYSPNGKQIVFSGRDSGRFDIFIMNADGSNLKRLTSFQTVSQKWANNQSPSFSPDGRYIVFSSNKSGSYQLYIMNLSGTYLKRITHDAQNYTQPRWSPFLGFTNQKQ